MNTFYNKIRNLGIASVGLLMLSSCSDILDEQPRTIYEPGFFQEEEGIMGGLTALYAHLRDTYGNGYYLNAYETGTDEYTWGHDADSNYKNGDLSGVGSLNAETCRADALWNNAFTYINTASGIIENGTAAGMDESLVSEARFFRAFDYFRLVQTFGGVPLDLGAGELKFNNSPSRLSVRNTVPEVYTKAIFPDLLTAIENLPETGRITGGVTKTAARITLAWAYLTYGWWLENPNNIPTYPECDRVDPDGHDKQWYFQAAYDLALEGIQNPGPFGLQPTFYDVNVGSNDRNNEIVLYADHTQESEQYNGGSLSWANGSTGENFAAWMVTWDYTLQTAKRPDTGESYNPVQRIAIQDGGRPWKCMAPPHEVFTNTFADKVNDSRFDGTFTTVYRANWDLAHAGNSPATLINANDMHISPGDPVLTFITDYDAPAGSTYTTENTVGGFEAPGRSDYVVPLSAISRRKYPALWKIAMYRTDNGDGLGSPNGCITRPYPAIKFSELYFIGAEAAVKGATAQPGYSARDLINVIRGRAGKWRFNRVTNTEYIADHSTDMTNATPQTITIDYLVDELSREYFGEGRRWYDLVRTQTWRERAEKFTIAGPATEDHTPETFTRDIPDGYYLRPIPQAQLDGMEMTDAERNEYQNPAYRW